MDARCSVESCRVKIYARELCGRHYRQQLRHGQVSPDRLPRECEVPGCDRRARTRGWCHGHYLRWSRTGDFQADVPLRRSSRGTCAVSGCARAVASAGLCEAHRQRVRLTGDAAADTPLREPPALRHLSHGYVRVPVPAADRWLVNGATTAAEHRLVMSRTLRRPLTAKESVHHRNGDRTDNRPDNLELWTRWQPTGGRVEDKVAWAKEILERYAPECLARP